MIYFIQINTVLRNVLLQYCFLCIFKWMISRCSVHHHYSWQIQTVCTPIVCVCYCKICGLFLSFRRITCHMKISCLTSIHIPEVSAGFIIIWVSQSSAGMILIIIQELIMFNSIQTSTWFLITCDSLCLF